jgi:hypothetical protein
VRNLPPLDISLDRAERVLDGAPCTVHRAPCARRALGFRAQLLHAGVRYLIARLRVWTPDGREAPAAFDRAVPSGVAAS